MDEHMIVKCLTCGATWDNDFEPPGCTDPDHKHHLDVVKVERKSGSESEPKKPWTGDLSA